MKLSLTRGRVALLVLLAACIGVGMLVYRPASEAAASLGTGAHAVSGGKAATTSASAASVMRRAPSAGSAIPVGLPPVDPIDPAAYATTLPSGQLFAHRPAARRYFAHKLPFGVDERSYIEFNRSALGALTPGQTIDIQMPDDGRTHTLRVDAVEVHPNGDKSWTGRVLGGRGEVLPVVFTQGVDSSFGSISTSGATYSLEAEGKWGWIANVDALRRHQDFSRPDVFVPDPRKDVPPPSAP